MSRTRRKSLLVVLVLAGWASSGLARGAAPVQEEPGRTPGARAETSGTVRAIDAERQQVSVLTGVGHAVRVLSFHAGPGCEVTIAGTPSELAGLEPGAIVRVRYLEGPEPHEAESIAAHTAGTEEIER